MTTTLGSTLFVNHGLVGVGRISASSKDAFGETFGSVSGLQIDELDPERERHLLGTFDILPDRGYNAGAFFSDYAARINLVDFAFKPHPGAGAIGGSTIAKKIKAQKQIKLTSPIRGVRFTYDDPLAGVARLTTGLDPGGSFTTTLFGGQNVPYVDTYSGPLTPTTDCVATPSECQPRDVQKLTLDSEALVLKDDGSGYIGDEYGANVYYFDATKKITGVIVPPPAFQPHFPRPASRTSAPSTHRSTAAATTRASRAWPSVPMARTSSRCCRARRSRTPMAASRTAARRACWSTT